MVPSTLATKVENVTSTALDLDLQSNIKLRDREKLKGPQDNHFIYDANYIPAFAQLGTLDFGYEYDIVLQRSVASYDRKVVGKVVRAETDKLKRIFRKQVNFLLSSFLLIVASLVGMILFYLFDFYIIHPTIYLVTLAMGIGWCATAIVSIYEDKTSGGLS